MKAKIGIFFFLLGLIISAVFGAIVGNKIIYTVVVALISGVCLAIVSLIVLKILEIKVPEVIEFLESFSYTSYSEEEYSSEEEDSEVSETIEDYADRQSSFASKPYEEKAPIKSSANKQKEKSSSNDVITIDNITIKNEPKLMAEAIRTILATDESPSSLTPHK